MWPFRSAKVEIEPQEIGVVENDVPSERNLSKAKQQVVRWEKVIATYENATDETNRARYRKAVEQRNWWQKLADLAASKPGA